MPLIRRKLKLSESPKSQKIFSIHLIESDSGHVRVVSDYTGEGDAVLNLGIEIMNSLAMIQPHTEGYLMFSPALRSDTKH